MTNDTTPANVHQGIASLRPYQPGKPIDELARELGLDDIVKLASNENPRGPGELVREAIRSEFASLSRYPDGNGYVLKQTLVQHLRKRLENATRAYVSVQVNTAGWGESEVLAFARDEGLLAPQFAKNLWQRVVNTPMQITDYFTGYHHFRRLFADYRALPNNPGIRAWVDAVLQAGPVPPVMLSSLL